MANPTVFRWQAPTTSEDGTPIDYALNYELGEDDGTGVYTPIVTIVGALQPDDFYEAQVDQIAWTVGEHTVALRTINAEEEGKVSAWSNPATFVWSDRIPNPPLFFSVV